MVIKETTLRDRVESGLIDMFEEVRPFSPSEGVVDRYKDGGFGTSNISFALYSNGHNKRGLSSHNPYGLIYEDGRTLFSIGYFKRELDSPDDLGYVTLVAPRGRETMEVVETVENFTKRVLQSDLPAKGIYVRFLTLNQYREFISRGFLPIEEAPWHDDAPKEDETYSNSVLSLTDCRKRIKDSGSRFKNFLKRNNLEYKIEQFAPSHKIDAIEILNVHFGMLKDLGKQIGSTPEDHFNSLDCSILNLKSVRGMIGFLGDTPASFYIGEFLSKNRFGLYTGYTLRKRAHFEKHIKDPKGFTAMPLYAYGLLIKELEKEGITEVHLGGSELPSLNSFKRILGAKIDPTYWVLRLKDKF